MTGERDDWDDRIEELGKNWSDERKREVTEGAKKIEATMAYRALVKKLTDVSGHPNPNYIKETFMFLRGDTEGIKKDVNNDQAEKLAQLARSDNEENHKMFLEIFLSIPDIE